MAPKKSNKSKPGKKLVKEPVKEAPRRSARHRREQPPPPPTTDEDEGIVTSQGSEDVDISRLLKTVFASTRARQETNRKKVISAYKAKVAKQKSQIISIFDEHLKKAAQTHRIHLTRLANLLRRKASIEADMRASTARLERGYLQITKELLCASRAMQHDLRSDEGHL